MRGDLRDLYRARNGKISQDFRDRFGRRRKVRLGYGLEKKNRAPTGGPEVSAAEGRERECCARGPGRWAENELGRSRRGGGGKLGAGLAGPRSGFPRGFSPFSFFLFYFLFFFFSYFFFVF